MQKKQYLCSEIAEKGQKNNLKVGIYNNAYKSKNYVKRYFIYHR